MNNKKRGWFGNPTGHAKAGSQSSGKFRKGEARAREYGRLGGKVSPTKFQEGDSRAQEAGRRGGRSSRREERR